MKRLNLEISLKPFYGLSGSALDDVCLRALRQWDGLVVQAESLSVMLWCGDGSEILDYGGDLDASTEWGRYIGNCNPKLEMKSDPERVSLHSRAHLYREDARPITYRWLGEVVQAWKHAGLKHSGKLVRVGMTFDPGGEFAPSDFKYKRHPEICLADTLGKASFVACYGVLRQDDHAYAGFPKGIPEGTSLGTFLGRQARLFAADLGFDFLWLSNGFGFGLECWRVPGPLFDGEKFDAQSAGAIRKKILGFWQDFRHECPSLGLETRGTNLGTGTDLASDATPLREIYEGGFNIEPPPNSPWAALDGDFGLELMGYLSRIAELPPGKDALFRFYLHDPWWLNSPWLDRYARQPHDIYLPLALARIDAEGHAVVPEKLSLLTVDDSYGRMPEICPQEIIPHLTQAWKDRPDEAGPLVWLYPFDELHDLAQGERAFHADWFVREAINDGVPLNTVASTRTLQSPTARGTLRERIIIAPTPFAGSTYGTELLRMVDNGARVMLYGPIDPGPNANEFLSRLGLEKAAPLEGNFALAATGAFDGVTNPPTRFIHRSVTCCGPLTERLSPGRAGVEARQNSEARALTAFAPPTATGGLLAWIRGPLPFSVPATCQLPQSDPAGSTYPLASLTRVALAHLGWTIRFSQDAPGRRHPVLTFHRHDNGFLLSSFTPDTTVSTQLKTPWGAPLLLDAETILREGMATYSFPRASHQECRIFVDQCEGWLSCREEVSGEIGIIRRFRVQGLKDAILRFFPSTKPGRVTFQNDPAWPFVTGPFLDARDISTNGRCLEIGPVTGSVLISW